jgi:putative metallohydrolase (TIGR04338 family)
MTATMVLRDTQRCRVYAWERAAVASGHWEPCFDSLDTAQNWANQVWRSERGRLGLGGVAPPEVRRPHRGQRRALAYHHAHAITLPRWARSRWVVLHELAHLLTPGGAPHGPRFVGALIGLGARWLDLDAQALMRAADEAGVRYWVRTVGSVPVHGPAWHVSQALQGCVRPVSLMQLQCDLSLGHGLAYSPAQVRGAVLHLVASGQAVWRRQMLVLVNRGPRAPIGGASPDHGSTSRGRSRSSRSAAAQQLARPLWASATPLPQETFAWDS